MIAASQVLAAVRALPAAAPAQPDFRDRPAALALARVVRGIEAYLRAQAGGPQRRRAG